MIQGYKMKSARSTTSTLLILAVILIALCIGCFIFNPFYYYSYAIPNKTRMLVQLKQIGSATNLYVEDNDNRLPHASSMPTYRAQVVVYTSNDGKQTPDIFREIPDLFTSPQFNFNLAGVKLDGYDIPLIPDGVMPTEKAALAFSIPLVNEINSSAIVVYVNGGARSIRGNSSTTYSDIFEPQFDRSKATLAPANYLADRDPLKKSK